MGLVPGARLPVRSKTPRPSSSKRPSTSGAQHGLDEMSKEDGIAFCERLFAKYLDGASAACRNAAHLRGSAQWIQFPRVVNQEWVHYKPRAAAARRRSC